MEKRRTAPRIKVNGVQAWIQIRRSIWARKESEKVSLVDLGPKGMSYERAVPLAMGTRFGFVIDIQYKTRIKGIGTVKNSRKIGDRHVLGVEFSKLDPEGKSFLSNIRNLLSLSGDNVLDEEMALPNKLKRLRRAIGMTVVEVAMVAGLSPSFLTKLENGSEKNPPLESLYKLSWSMGISLTDLTGQDFDIPIQVEQRALNSLSVTSGWPAL